MTKLKIVFIIPSLKAGGAERVLSFLSGHLDSYYFAPYLLVIGYAKDAVYKYPESCTTFLDKKKTRQAIFAIMKFLIRTKPNIAMSSIGQVNVLLGLFSIIFKKTKFIGRIASVNSARLEFSKTKTSLFSKSLYSFTHKRLDKIICQSEDMLKDLEVVYEIPKTRMILINNPITSCPEKIRTKSEKEDVIKYITVGRLTEVKGHDRLLRHLAKVINHKYQYTIVGTGSLEESLKTLAKDLGISKKVVFAGHINQVNDILIEHDIFLQGSYVEGFPNAVLESCVAGVPVLAFNVPGGTKEIIKNGKNGFLADSEEGFQNLLNDHTELLNLNPESISRYTKEKFSTEKILGQYEKVFLELAK